MPRSITLTALDIGTSFVKGICGRKDLKTGDIEVLAQLEYPCFGVRSGEVVKPEQVSQIILKVKEKLSQQAGIRINEVLVNIGGPHLFTIPSQGLVSVSRADQKISKEDIQRVLRAAQAINLPSNKEILDILPREFLVDGEGGVKDPLGLEGIRLEAKVLLICIFSPILENLEKALSLADLQILDVVSSPLAASRVVLTPQQKELGVCLVEIGAGTTEITVFEKGDLIDFAVFPIGSANITNDIAIGLRTEIHTAERIKKEFGGLNSREKKGKREKIKIPESSLAFPKKFLRDIIEARVSDIFNEVQKTLKKISGGILLPAGIVLTGGGSLLPGLVEFSKQKLKLPCRLGKIKEIPNVEDLQFSTCAGVLLNGFDFKQEEKEKGFGGSFGEKLRRLFRIFLP